MLFRSWQRSHRLAEAAQLTADHVMGSAAIPVLFPPVALGARWLGDGGIRMTAPLSPPLHLGANRVLAIGIRHPGTSSSMPPSGSPPPASGISLAEIAGVLLNAAFLDGHIESTTSSELGMQFPFGHPRARWDKK